MADYSGTIAADSTAQTAAAADPHRVWLLIQNASSVDLYYNFGTAAVADSPSLLLLPGVTDIYTGEAAQYISQAVSIIGGTGSMGAKFTIKDAKR